MRSLRERFDEKYIPEPNTGCWLWVGAYATYGQIWLEGEMVYAHRASYQLHCGDIGTDHILHKCDQPICVNPDHLYAGSHADNMRDRSLRERCGKTRLTTEQVLEIRASTERNCVIAKRLAVHPTTISAIRTGRSWKHLL